ncbi:MAG: hypothetical protein QG656_1596, partial [Candidatus Hydrogenedentes bacterium]|nr:hypothetical protein [Candidatus Hydrogenedentota bacterium]
MRFKRNRGSALMLTLGYTTAITLFVAVFLGAVHRTMHQCGEREREQQCLALAEAGIEKAIAELRAQGDAYTGEQDTSLGSGVFSVTVQPGAGEYRIDATAELRDEDNVSARARIAVSLTLS